MPKGSHMKCLLGIAPMLASLTDVDKKHSTSAPCGTLDSIKMAQADTQCCNADLTCMARESEAVAGMEFGPMDDSSELC